MEDYLFCPKPATGYSRLALDLERHAKNYIPKGFVESIDKYSHAPSIMENEAKTFIALHERGILKSGLEKLGNSKKYPFKKLGKWDVREAIVDFFDKKSYKSYQKELD
jgi:hypothetical protein